MLNDFTKILFLLLSLLIFSFIYFVIFWGISVILSQQMESRKRKLNSDSTKETANGDPKKTNGDPKKTNGDPKKSNVNTNWNIFLKKYNNCNNITPSLNKDVKKAELKPSTDSKPKPQLNRPKINHSKSSRTYSHLVHNGKLVAIDCEMVEIRDGSSILARVSIVDSRGNTIYDTFVKPREAVKDYRTHVSGVRPHDFENAKSFELVQTEVANHLKGKLLIGHALKNDLRVLYLSHSKKQIRDTAKYKPFRALNGGKTPSLKFLTKSILNQDIQDGEHDSRIDAKSTMLIYLKHRETWEKELKTKSKKLSK